MTLSLDIEAPETLLGVSAAFDGEHLIAGDVEIRGGRVARLGVGAGVGAHIAAPGFVDLQLNGFSGVDLQTADAATVRDMAAPLTATGVTAYQPTIITAPPTEMAAALAELAHIEQGPGLPHVLPAHLEGPFLSPDYRGAHPLEAVATPGLDLLRELLSAGEVGYVTLAPELPGALALIEELRSRNVVVALGHSNATAEEADAGFDAGITAITHAFNAMRPFHHREPGPVARALERGDIWITAIADPVHLHPTALHLLQCVAGKRFVAISDAMVAAGLDDGQYKFGRLEVTLSGGRALLADGRLAGSAATLDASVRELLALGVPLEASLAAVTSRPASVIGDRELGHLRVGGPADIVILDAELHPVTTYIGGVPGGQLQAIQEESIG
ncbi:MAG TPA: N-acetylglucosamine-6-phosphate deacetylase [Solirubrobacteraceae bacterium]|nr:N-acetylglucosamine-6-phosphate deacetylase [Solirubrobacteraceae bacterium]